MSTPLRRASWTFSKETGCPQEPGYRPLNHAPASGRAGGGSRSSPGSGRGAQPAALGRARWRPARWQQDPAGRAGPGWARPGCARRRRGAALLLRRPPRARRSPWAPRRGLTDRGGSAAGAQPGAARGDRAPGRGGGRGAGQCAAISGVTCAPAARGKDKAVCKSPSPSPSPAPGG